MHIEIQVALNFVISYLYNKLPRRRVNIFGEELEKALKDKFQGHWYPDKPVKGSAFRCLKTGDPIDPVLEVAARESGVPIQDILENLPQELAVWVDPGEVSYRIGEKGQVKILYNDTTVETAQEETTSADREVTKTFNPEAQCFRPIEAVGSSLSSLSLSPKSTSPFSGNSPTPPFKSASPVAAFLSRSTAPLTFTTATFAQTKFGSTKLKSSSKRAHRMSPTEFSNYIKQRAMQQQQQQQQQPGVPPQQPPSAFVSPPITTTQTPQQTPSIVTPRPRSLSPNPSCAPTPQQIQDAFYGFAPHQPSNSGHQTMGAFHPHQSHHPFSRSLFDPAPPTFVTDLLVPPPQPSPQSTKFGSFVDTTLPASGHYYTAATSPGVASVTGSSASDSKQLLESLNFGLCQQHLLVAN